MRIQAANRDNPKIIHGISLRPELLDAVRQDAEHFNCSMSFVVNTAIALALGIEIEEKYYIDVERKKAMTNGRRK